jgi:hypothetical protein
MHRRSSAAHAQVAILTAQERSWQPVSLVRFTQMTNREPTSSCFSITPGAKRPRRLGFVTLRVIERSSARAVIGM